MSKAKQKALEAYPIKIAPRDGYDENLRERKGFIKGYSQAEKDLELTWEDIETIGELRLNVALELRRKELESSTKSPLKFTTEDMCKEVLKRFKEMKKLT